MPGTLREQKSLPSRGIRVAIAGILADQKSLPSRVYAMQWTPVDSNDG